MLCAVSRDVTRGIRHGVLLGHRGDSAENGSFLTDNSWNIQTCPLPQMDYQLKKKQ